MGYTTCADSDVLAFGPSAISDVGGSYLQNEREVHAWAQLLEDGGLAVVRGHSLSLEDKARRDLIMQLFCQLEVDLDAVARRHPGALDGGFQAEELALRKLENDGLVVRKDARVRVSSDGQLLLRTVASAFDTYFRSATTVRRHAPAI